MFEELLHDRGPLIAPLPNSLEMKHLENVIRHLHGQIKLNSNAIKRQRKAKKASVIAQRKATIAQNMAGLPGGSRPGTPGQPAVVVKSATTEMAEKWADVEKTTEEEPGADEKEEVRMRGEMNEVWLATCMIFLPTLTTLYNPHLPTTTNHHHRFALSSI